MRYFILILISLLVIEASHAQITQPTDAKKSQLASRYLRSKEYEKAAKLFEELYHETGFTHYYDYYINCLIGMKDYDEAEKVLKKRIRKENNPALYVTLGFVYKDSGDNENANIAFNNAINKLTPNKGIIAAVASKFYSKGEFDFAIDTYKQGRTLIPGEMFHADLARIFSYQRNHSAMMNEYMLLLNTQEKMLGTVQARLNSLLRNDYDGSLQEIIKEEIFSSIQKYPGNNVYNRLLIWFFVQSKDYNNALVQSIALDRRTKTEENNIINFTKNAINLKQYDISKQGLNYLLNRTPKPDINIITTAKQELVRVEYLKYINSPDSLRIPNIEVEKCFEDFFEDVGFQRTTIDLAKENAHFLAFYSNKADEALLFLDKAIKAKGINNSQRAILEIEYADIKVYQNELWEATLLYERIVEQNKNNPIGDDVKLKRAKCAYYLGQIDWAKAQLDVLKASTSKLIANDAMELALLITSHYDMDTISEPIQLFALADLHLFRNHDQEAMKTLEMLEFAFPSHSLRDKILMRKAYINEKHFDYQSAAELYEKTFTDYSYSTSADDAMYKLAQLYEFNLAQPEKAQALYRKILTEYPGSIFVVDARQRFRILRGDIIEEEPLKDEVF